MTLSFSMMYTCAPQPESASRSTALSSACEMVSKRSSGPRSGSQRPSQVPKSWSEAVPETMKSLAKSMHPMLSNLDGPYHQYCQKSSLLISCSNAYPQMNGFPDVPSIPATTGLTNHGPNRRSYRLLLTRFENVLGLMSRSSRRRYMLTL